jgi:hypothetical protein
MRRRSYIATVCFRVSLAGQDPSPPHPLAALWGPGHLGSVWAGDQLTVVARVPAACPAEAVAVVTRRACAIWPYVGVGTLTPHTSWARRTRRLLPAGPFIPVGGGPGRPDDEGGGLAGVREPRRPPPSPGHLYAAALPPAGRGC